MLYYIPMSFYPCFQIDLLICQASLSLLLCVDFVDSSLRKENPVTTSLLKKALSYLNLRPDPVLQSEPAQAVFRRPRDFLFPVAHDHDGLIMSDATLA